MDGRQFLTLTAPRVPTTLATFTVTADRGGPGLLAALSTSSPSPSPFPGSPLSSPLSSRNGTLWTDPCGTPQYTFIDYGSTASYVPFIGCVDSRLECCPFTPVTTTVGAAGTSTRICPQSRDAKDAVVKSCPADYYSVAGGCCPNAYTPWTAPLGGATPWYSSVAVPATPTPPPTATPLPSTIPAKSSRQHRTYRPTVTVTVTLSAMQYAVQPEGTPMSPGWIAGTAVGCALAVGALIGAGRCCLRWKRKHREQGQRGPNHHSAPFGFDPGSSELPTTTVSWLFRDSTPPEANNRKFGFLGGLNGNQRDRQDSLYINLRDVAEAARVKRSAAREAYPLEPIQAFSASDIPSTGQASQGEPLPGESSNSATNGTTTPAPVHAKPEHLSWDAVMHGALMPSSKALTTALPEHWLLPGGSSSNPGSSSGDGGGGATATTSAPSISYPPDEPPIFNAMSRHGRLPTWLDGPPRRSRRPAAQPAPAPAPTPPDPPLRDHYLRPPPRPAPATSSKEQRRQQKAIARQQRIMARPRAAYEYQGGNMVFGEPL